MGFFGTILFLATTGVSIYYFPELFFGISWKNLAEIRNSDSLNAISSIFKNLGWTAETAVDEANRIFTISIIVSVIVGIIVIASILYSYRRIGK